MGSYPEGQLVQVKFNGRVADSYYAQRIDGRSGLFTVPDSVAGWIDVADDATGCVHVLWMNQNSSAIAFKPEPEPEYQIGKVYRDAHGTHYLRGYGYWFAFGEPDMIGHSVPRRPLRKVSA